MEEHLGAEDPEHAEADQLCEHAVRDLPVRPPLLPPQYSSPHPVVQAYRNISRTTRQYFYGDQNAEQFLILELRNQFKLPYYCQTPVELIKDGAVPLAPLRNAASLTRSTATTNFSATTTTPSS